MHPVQQQQQDLHRPSRDLLAGIIIKTRSICSSNEFSSESLAFPALPAELAASLHNIEFELLLIHLNYFVLIIPGPEIYCDDFPSLFSLKIISSRTFSILAKEAGGAAEAAAAINPVGISLSFLLLSRNHKIHRITKFHKINKLSHKFEEPE